MDDASKLDDDEIIVAVLIDEEEDIVLDLENHDEVVVELSDRRLTTLSVDGSLYPVAAFIEDESKFIIDEGDSIELLDLDQVVVDTFQERRQQKFIAQSRTKKQWTLITIGVIALIFVLALLTLESPMYDINKVELKNSSTLELTETEQLEIQKILKPLEGRPMYRVNTDAATKRIASLPTISEVNVEKSWPSTLNIIVNRRVPIAYIETDKGFVLVDSLGFVFQKSEKIPVGLVSFDGLEEVTFTKRIADKSYLDIIKAAPDEIRNQITNVGKSRDGYEVELTDGIDIRLGNNSQLKEKLAISWSIILAKPRSELGYIDVSVPTLPVSGSPQLKV